MNKLKIKIDPRKYLVELSIKDIFFNEIISFEEKRNIIESKNIWISGRILKDKIK